MTWMGLNRINTISTELGKTETYASELIFKFTVNNTTTHSKDCFVCNIHKIC